VAAKPRGRPKTLDKQRLTELAMVHLWEKGPASVSLNQICEIARVSKPGVYREFGDADGLVRAALTLYDDKVLTPLRGLFQSQLPAPQTLDNVVAFTTNVDSRFPKGCLYVKAKQSQLDLKDGARTLLETIRKRNLAVYEAWAAETRVHPSLTPPLAAQYIDAQLEIALALIGRGTPPADVATMLRRALSALVSPAENRSQSV